MTDKERFKALMADFGVKLKESSCKATEMLVIEQVHDKSNPKVTGYNNFCAEFTFNAHNGKFMEVGLWE